VDCLRVVSSADVDSVQAWRATLLTTAGIVVDSQSINTAERRVVRGYNAARHVVGRKRYLLVDTLEG
jgi:hypothetical protein